MSGTDPLSPLPFGADGGAPKLAGRRRHHGLGVGRGEGDMPAGEDAMMATAAPAGVMSASGDGGRRRRRHTARGGVDAGRRRKHSRRAGEDAVAGAAVAGRRRRSHSARGVPDAGRRRSRRHTRKH